MTYDRLDKVNIYRKLKQYDTYDEIYVVYHDESEKMTNIKIRPQKA
jgi:hypothetical protein